MLITVEPFYLKYEKCCRMGRSFYSAQERSRNLGFCSGFSLHQTHQQEWQSIPKSKPVSVDDSLAKDDIPRAKCQT